MGGKHKKSISQMEKQQMLARLRAIRGKRRFEVMEKTIRNIIISDDIIKQIRNEIHNMRYITPSSIALKYNLRLSVAKDILEQLEREGKLTRVTKSRRVIVYKPIAAS